MKEKKTLSKSARFLLVLSAVQNVFYCFQDVYLTALLSLVTDGSYLQIAIYYIIAFTVLGVTSLLIGGFVKKNYIRCFLIGISSNFVYFVALLAMSKGMLCYQVAAVINGIALACFHAPFNLINSRWIGSEQERVRFSGISGGIGRAMGIVLPITLGKLITTVNYTPVIIILTISSAIQFITTLFARKTAKCIPSEKRYDLSAYIRKAFESKEIPLFFVIKMLSGVTFNGAQRQIINLLILAHYGSEMSLGQIASVFSLMSIASFLLLGKYGSTKHYSKILTICGCIQIFAVVMLLTSVNKMTIILITFSFDVAVGMISKILDNKTFDLANKKANLDYQMEYLACGEMAMNIGRNISWAALIVIGLLKSTMAMVLAILVINVFFVVMIALSANMTKMRDQKDS